MRAFGPIVNVEGGDDEPRSTETNRASLRIRAREDHAVWQAGTARLIDPLGVELSATQGGGFSKGDEVDVELTAEGKRSRLEGVIVDLSSDQPGTDLISIRFVAPHPQPSESNQRHSNRWICSEEHLPQAVAAAPGRYNEFMWFQVTNVSEDGLQLHTGLVNRFLVPGMALRLTVTLPMVGETQIGIRVVRVRITVERGKDILEIGAEMIDLTRRTRSLLGQYLLQFSTSSSPDDLYRSGLSPRGLRDLHLHYLRTATDYQEVLELRSSTSQPPSNLPDMAKRSDRDARMVVARRAGKVVGTACIRLPTSSTKLVSEDIISWSTELPRRDEILEVSAISIASNRRQSLTLIQLMRFICTTCVTEQRPHVVSVIPTRLCSPLTKAGWKPLSRPGTTPLVVLIGDLYSGIKGGRAGPIYWNYVWSDVYDHLRSRATSQPIGIDRAMLACYRAARLPSQIFFLFKSLPGRYISNHS